MNKWVSWKDETIITIVNALEKEIAKDIHIYTNGEVHCPNCDENLTGLGFKRCIECGQRLGKDD